MIEVEFREALARVAEKISLKDINNVILKLIRFTI